jgi:predicted ATPase/Tfp pilus assembly protein PilF
MATIGRYQLGALLGKGGGGEVRRATLIGPAGLRREVALKVLHSGSAGLRREARIGGLLRHKHLVDVFEVGQHEGRWFCAMELCDGTLATHLPLSPRAVVEVGLQICIALQYAHAELGLVHLDIKPSNLLLADGVVKVADLGISQAEGFALDGRIRGTPSYMAPEQVRGGHVDPRTDLYALGITLVELATGMLPTATETLDLGSLDLAKTLSAEDLDLVNTPALVGVPEWLAPAVNRCVEVDPQDRWASMAELAQALRGLQVAGDDLRTAIGWTPPSAEFLRDQPVLDTAFIGRSAETQQISHALQTPGITALRGPAGIGKSRLAGHAAQQWGANHDGLILVDLSESRSIEGLTLVVARALGVATGRQDPVQRLGFALAGRGTMVLVLDNVDQLPDLGPMLADWTGKAPHLRVLLTSRRAPDVAPNIITVGPLPVADGIALLVARARQRGVELAGNPKLAELANRLEGLPLALELAAGRLGVLSVADVLDHIDLSWLRAGTDDRHTTLRTAMDWSWGLLSADEQRALTQLSVFEGGWTVEAAEAVVDLQDGLVIEVLDALVAHSWLHPLANQRMGCMETARVYAAQNGPTGATVARHGDYFATFGAESAIVALAAHGGVARMRALDHELANLVLACRRALADDRGVHAAGAALAAWAVFNNTGPLGLGLQLLEAVSQLQLPGPLGRRVDQSHALALCANGQLERGEVAQREMLQRFRDADDARGEGIALAARGTLFYRQNKHSQALESYEAGLVLHRLHGPQQAVGLAHSNLANLHSDEGRMDLALDHYTQALEMHRAVGNRRSEGTAMSNLGVLYSDTGRLEEAETTYKIARDILHETGARMVEGAVLCNLGSLYIRQERYEQGEALIRQALDLHRTTGDVRSEALDLGNLAILYRDLARADLARPLFKQAIERAMLCGDTGTASTLIQMLGDL